MTTSAAIGIAPPNPPIPQKAKVLGGFPVPGKSRDSPVEFHSETRASVQRFNLGRP
jgi:hypothetical protein